MAATPVNEDKENDCRMKTSWIYQMLYDQSDCCSQCTHTSFFSLDASGYARSHKLRAH